MPMTTLVRKILKLSGKLGTGWTSYEIDMLSDASEAKQEAFLSRLRSQLDTLRTNEARARNLMARI